MSKAKRVKMVMKASKEIWAKREIGDCLDLLASLESQDHRVLKEVKDHVAKQELLDHQVTREKLVLPGSQAILGVLEKKETKDSKGVMEYLEPKESGAVTAPLVKEDKLVHGASGERGDAEVAKAFLVARVIQANQAHLDLLDLQVKMDLRA